MDEAQSTEAKGPGRMSNVMSWVLTFAVAFAVAMFVRAFVVEAFVVPSGSMLDTIQLDDRIGVEKLTYRVRGPEPGEVVTFDSPNGNGTTLVKRVIATGGQTVDIRDGSVVVDGTVLDEPYTQGKPTTPLSEHMSGTAPIAYPYTVPEGHIWVMGDNRTNSRDSRYFGPVPTSAVTGRAMFVFWPFSDARWL